MIIDEIKQARMALLTVEHKSFIKKYLKRELLKKDFAVIEGASHFSRHDGDKWIMRDEPERNFMRCRAPFRCHAAIADWLRSEGFHTDRYINKGGVDYGLKIWI